VSEPDERGDAASEVDGTADGWTRRHPVPAALVVGVAAYLFFGLTQTGIGGATPAQAWGWATLLGAAFVGFVSWAVFTRHRDPHARRGEPPGDDGLT
jgi:hypothetical protein